MADLAELRAFVEVAAAGGFSRAAAKLGLSKSIVSRRIAALEADAGVRLLSRTTRGVSLTEAGSELNKRALQILAEFDEALDAVAGRDNVITGRLTSLRPCPLGSRIWPLPSRNSQPSIRSSSSMSCIATGLLTSSGKASMQPCVLPNSRIRA